MNWIDEATKEALKKKDPATERKILISYIYVMIFSLAGLAFFFWLYNIDSPSQGNKIIGMIGIFFFVVMTISIISLSIQGLLDLRKNKPQ